LNVGKFPVWVWAAGLLALLLLAGTACNLPALPRSTPILAPTLAPPGSTPPPPHVLSTPTLPSLLHRDLTPQPGLLLRGYVLAPDGSGVAQAEILRGYASYPPVLVAVSNADGYFESDLQPIPGDELLRVSARLEGFTVLTDGPNCSAEECAWRHYHGYEESVLYFRAIPRP
jgi:hypothetical protein